MNLIGNTLGRLFLWATRSLENPTTSLSDPDEWAVDMLVGGKTAASGVKVSRKKALGHAPVWRAVSLISGDVAKLPIHVYRRDGEGKTPDTKHPASRLLRFAPNDEMTAFTFWQTLTAHLLLDGNAYAYIVRNGAGDPEELWPLLPDQTYPVRENGTLWYVTRIDRGGGAVEWRKLPPEDVFHVKGLGFNGLVGYSVIAHAKESWGLGIGAEQYGSRFLKNSARPSTVIEVPGAMNVDAQKEFIRQWEKMHSGLDNSHRTAILTKGGTANPLSINARDAQLLETRQFQIREVANWFDLPPHKLGDDSRTSYKSLEEENQAYLNDCLDRRLRAIEQEARAKLLREREKEADTHFVEFVRQALIRADLVKRFNAYAKALLGGWMCVDEVRARENLNPLPDGEGKKFFRPLNVAVVGEEEKSEGGGEKGEEGVEPKGEEGKAAGEEDPARDMQPVLAAHRELLIDTLKRMARRLAVHAVRTARRGGQPWDGLDDHRSVIEQALTPAIGAWAALSGKGPQEAIERLARQLLREFDARALKDTPNIEAITERIVGEVPELLADELILQTRSYELTTEN